MRARGAGAPAEEAGLALGVVLSLASFFGPRPRAAEAARGPRQAAVRAAPVAEVR